jgi:hypothetical protein
VNSIFLKTNHLFLRNPHGGVEDVVAMRNAGFSAIFCNIGDHMTDEWGEIRLRAKTAGMVCGPWLRTSDANNNFSRDRLDHLIQVADNWETPLIVNSESELQGSGNELTSLIRSELGDRDAAISMEPWPFANVAWWPLAKYPVLPQIFPQDSDAATRPEQCREGWYNNGIKCVVFTFGSYGTMEAVDYKRLSPYGVYTADDCGNDYQAWHSQGTHNPCVPESEEDMQLIGNDDGVKAEYNALRDMDPSKTLLKKKDGKWPDISTIKVPLDQWKAWDKAQRRAQILVDDHDESMQ